MIGREASSTADRGEVPAEPPSRAGMGGRLAYEEGIKVLLAEDAPKAAWKVWGYLMVSIGGWEEAVRYRARIAEACGLHVDTVKKTLRQLLQWGLFERRLRFDRTGAPGRTQRANGWRTGAVVVGAVQARRERASASCGQRGGQVPRPVPAPGGRNAPLRGRRTPPPASLSFNQSESFGGAAAPVGSAVWRAAMLAGLPAGLRRQMVPLEALQGLGGASA